MDSIKNKVHAIIFDMDGTIINTESAWKNATLDTIKKFSGLTEFTDEQIKFLHTLSGTGLYIAINAIKEQFNITNPVEEIADFKIKTADFYLAQDIAFIEGFESFHKKLQAIAMPTGVATNASRENLLNLAQRLNFTQFFGNHLYCSMDAGNKPKPDPAVFLHTAQKLGANPENCIVFEDSLAGFTAAKAAGMKCIAIKNDVNKHYLDQAHSAIATYHDAEDIIKKI
jgi:HAD superfamily hydrolase (TIGR01509 family)